GGCGCHLRSSNQFIDKTRRDMVPPTRLQLRAGQTLPCNRHRPELVLLQHCAEAGWGKQESNMGLLDVLNGMQHGPHGQRQPGQPSGAMSPLTMAILGLLAYKAVKHFTQNNPQPSSPGTGGGSSPVPPGGLGGALGGLLGGAGGLSDILKGGLGGALAGGAAG